MIYSLRGTLIESDPRTVVIECAGVGYGCRVTLNTLRQLPPLGSEAFLHTYMVVREDAMELYGFADTAELSCFKLLTTVNGVGPKAALSILSDFSPDRLALLIASSDAKSITKAAGVGPKMAQRIVLELKDKMGAADLGLVSEDVEAAGSASKSGGAAEAVAALTALGYSQSEAALAVGRLDSQLGVEELIKGALKSMAGQV